MKRILQTQRSFDPLVRGQEERVAVAQMVDQSPTFFPPDMSCMRMVCGEGVRPVVGYGRCGGSRYLWRELFRMVATAGAPPTRPFPPTLSPQPISPEFWVLGFGLNGSRTCLA